MTLYYLVAVLLLVLFSYRSHIYANIQRERETRNKIRRLHAIPKEYKEDYETLVTAFIIESIPIQQSSPVYYKILQLKKLFDMYARSFPDKTLGPSVEVIEHTFSSVTMIIRMRTLSSGPPVYAEATYTFQGNQLSEVMRNLKPLINRRNIIE